MDVRNFSKNMELALTTGKCSVGLREVKESVKGAKVVILSRTVNADEKSQLQKTLDEHSVPYATLDISSVELGRLCGRPFRISAISVRTLGEASIDGILRSIQAVETETSTPKAGKASGAK